MNSKFVQIFFLLLIFPFQSTFSENFILISAEKTKVNEIYDDLELPATVLSNESIEVTSVVSDKIKKILFKEGKFVKKNQLLVELIDNEEQAILKQILAELEEAEINYERALKLSLKGNISQSALDKRLMTKKKLAGKIEEIKARIEDLKIKAPFDGYTGVRNFSEGSFIKPGDVITKLYDTKTLKIQAFAPENFSQQIKIGLPFNIEFNFKSPMNIDGEISVVDPVIDNKTRTFRIIGQIRNTENKIKPGMMANIKIPLEKRLAFLVKEGSILSQDDISYVYVIVNKNEISQKRVKTGIRNNGMIEVIEGIDNEDLIVYEGINKIQKGSKIRIK
ncbi:MAG: efflux RND transporter periplasmic adaptor subunit [Pseudomonadota bacterium]|nr:efflux RND transporter periplasmic adaptor subunit [Pseudomonadota bacterium]